LRKLWSVSMNTCEPNSLYGILVPYEEDGEDGHRERSTRPKGCLGKIHMWEVWGVWPCPR
jgi:hypothetical protein